VYLLPVSLGCSSDGLFFFSQYPDASGDHFLLNLLEVLELDLEQLLLALRFL